ncbi:MAG: hypothetical protein ACREWG_00295, partial [Gammaproteobacteria bacterium]
GVCNAGEIAEWALGTLGAGQSRTVQLGSTINTGSSAPPDGSLIVTSASVNADTGSASVGKVLRVGSAPGI